MYHSPNNNFVITGIMGSDFELNWVREDLVVGNANVALSNGRDKETVWLRVAVWGDRAVNFFDSGKFTKGTLVHIAGVMNPDNLINKYTDKEGETQVSLNVEVHEMYEAVKFQKVDSNKNSSSIDEDELPF